LPFDKNDEQREGKENQEHCQKMTNPEWPKRGYEGTRFSFHQSS